MDPPRALSAKKPPPSFAYSTEDEAEIQRQTAMRDPVLASLMAQCKQKTVPAAAQTVATGKCSTVSATETQTSSSQDQEEDDYYENEGDGEHEGEETEAAGEEDMEDDQAQDDEEDPAETEEAEMAGYVHEDTAARTAYAADALKRLLNRNNRPVEPPRVTADRPPRHRRQRSSSYEEDDQTESGSTQDEDEESVSSEYQEEEEEPATDPNVIEEIDKFQATFRGIERRFRLINKIGEGTFSSVYKAEDLLYDKYDNSWDLEDTPPRRSGPRPPKYVAIKKIYVTSSPARIQNELELLHDLSGCKSVVPLITAFRYQDQVVAILPYFRHVDFREYFRSLTINDIISYFKSLFSALSHVHAHDIIHRDIKPTNFLYDVYRARGVLCDFGLAEREGTDSSFCMCQQSASERREMRLPSSMYTPSQGYPLNDSRPSRRANRAGTRGFRAPEVLFKCTSQTTKIDIWSAGVILLTILSKRFPFFNSSDDVDAIIEIATIFGKAKMRQCAALHGCIFETTIPTIGDKGFTLEKIVLWATNRISGGSSSNSNNRYEEKLPVGERLACKFLARCFELDPVKRISADEALQHEFLRYHEEPSSDEEEEDDGEEEEYDEEDGDEEGDEMEM